MLLGERGELVETLKRARFRKIVIAQVDAHAVKIEFFEKLEVSGHKTRACDQGASPPPQIVEGFAKAEARHSPWQIGQLKHEQLLNIVLLRPPSPKKTADVAQAVDRREMDWH